MKKSIRSITAITLAFTMMLTGCSLSSKKDTDTHSGTSGQITDDGKLTFNTDKDNAGESDSSEIVFFEDLFEPDLEDSSSGMNSEETSSEQETSPEENTEEQAVDDRLKMVFFGDSQFANGASDGTDIATLVSQRVPNSVSYN